MRITPRFVFFWRTPEVYSNWHPSPFERDGTAYANAEQYMMAAKARLFGDSAIEARILRETRPSQIKALGRRVRGYSDEKWVAHREQVMYDACLAKFRQNPAMRDELLGTENRLLVEASPVDQIWGIGLEENAPNVEDPAHWRGLNLLGKALMHVRCTLRSGALPEPRAEPARYTPP